ncbi:MAG: hypothetical protein AAF390_16925 [Pseudomonadota bacterium]
MGELHDAKPAPDGEPAPHRLPYDPVEWERRLAVARVQREKVKKEQAEAARRAGIAPEADGGAMARSPFDSDGFVGRRDAPPPVTADETGPEPAPDPGPRQGRGHAKPVLIGLAIGCVAGASLASLASGVPDISDLRGRIATLMPFVATPDRVPTAVTAVPAARPSPPEVGSPPDLFRATVPATPQRAAASRPAPAIRGRPPVAVAGGDARPVPVVASVPPVGPSALGDGASLDLVGGYWREGPDLPVVLPDRPALSAGPDAPLDRATRQTHGWREIAVIVPRRMPADLRADALSRLEGSDWSTDAPRTSPYTISETHVRYYHAADRAEAEALADHFGAEARGFTGHRPQPAAGHLELWLSGQGVPTRTVRRVRARVPNLQQIISRFIR